MNSRGSLPEDVLGTDTWIARAIGNFSSEDIKINGAGKLQVHPEIQSLAGEMWNQTLNLRKDALLGKAEKEGRKIEVFVKDENPFSALYSRENGIEKKELFSGPCVALIDFEVDDSVLSAIHGVTDYAVRTLMSTTPYSIIDKYGWECFVDSVNLSVLPTFIDGESEVGQTFRRHGFNLNEYPGSIGTIAGGFATRNQKIELSKVNPFHGMQKEMFEEGRLLPSLKEEDYKERGIIHPDAEVEFGNLDDGTRIAYVSRKGQPKIRALLYDESDLVCTGIATDINPLAKDPSGSKKQYIKSEYMFLCRTGIKRKHFDEIDEQGIQKGWPRSDEHTDCYYFPFTEEGIHDYVNKNHSESMGCTGSVISYSLIAFDNGMESIRRLAREVTRHPLDDHPFYSRLGTIIKI